MNPQNSDTTSAESAPVRVRLAWTPAPGTLRRMLAWFAVGGALIGLIGFAVSFTSVSAAARPYMGGASWTVPALVDLGIFTLAGLAIVLELHEISSWWIRLIPNGLAGFTVYLNTATQHSWFGKAVHAAGPVLWVTVVEIATFTVRHMVGLNSDNAMGKVRASRWLLSPLSTFRLWRRMRLWEITNYRDAIGREHERAASVALLRQWHGRLWRSKAPRAQRLAVRLQGVTTEPVADLLTRASLSITTAALAAAKPTATATLDTVSETTSDSVSGNTPAAVSQKLGNTGRTALHAVPETPRALPAPLSGNTEISAVRESELLSAAREVALSHGKRSAYHIGRELGVGLPLAQSLADVLTDEDQVTAAHAGPESVTSGRGLAPEQIAELIRTAGSERPGVREVMRTFAVSYDKAKAALALLNNAA